MTGIDTLWRVPCAGWDILSRTTPTTLVEEREARRFGVACLSQATLCVSAPTARQAVYLAGLYRLADHRAEIVMRDMVPVLIERARPGAMTSAQACGFAVLPSRRNRILEGSPA